MKESELNRDRHHQHRMPANTTMEQRLHWHLEHAKNCGCRPIPVKVTEEMNMEQNNPRVVSKAMRGSCVLRVTLSTQIVRCGAPL